MITPRCSPLHRVQCGFWRHTIPKILWSVMGLWCMFGVISAAYNLSPTDQLTLEAQNSVVCPEPGKIWIATGQVILKKGALVIQAHRIELEFEPKETAVAPSGRKNGTENNEKFGTPLFQPFLSGPVRRVTATGNVRIHHPSLSLSAPRAQYDFKTERMDAWGPGIVLRQNTPQDSKPRHPWVLTCATLLSYTQSTGVMNADGTVRLISQDKGIESDRLCALFGPEKPPAGNRLLDKTVLSKGLNPFQDSVDRENRPLQLIWARSDVRVRFWDTSKPIVALGQSALWDAVSETAKMQGNVRIRHKDQYLRCHKAKLDFSSHTIDITAENPGTVRQWPDSGGKHGGDNKGSKTFDQSRVYALIPTTFSRKKE